MENGERSCSIDLLIELSCILHVSTDYLLMGSEPSKEEVKNDLHEHYFGAVYDCEENLKRIFALEC